jgi:hypothetical protein
MNAPPDPRAGLPSASMLGRLSHCAASWQLSRQAVRQGIGNHSNSASDSGHRIHKWLETHGAAEWGALSEDEKETASRCYEQAEQIIADWGAEIDGCLAHREQRLWLFADGRVASTPSVLGEAPALFSGCADLIVHGTESRACIVDYKTGRGDYEPAAGNAQLLGLAVLVAGWAGARGIRVALVQPWAGPPSIADFDGAALDEAKAQLLELLAHIEQPGLTPTPGDWCHYCPARAGVCPVTTNELVMLANPLDTPEAIEEFIREEYDGPKLARILAIARRAKWTIAAAEAEAKRRIEAADPGAPPGWTLREGAKTREVTNLEETFALLAVDPVINLTAEEMRGACSLSLPTLEQAISKRSLIPKPKVAMRIADVLGPLVSYGRKAPSLVEVGSGKAELGSKKEALS